MESFEVTFVGKKDGLRRARLDIQNPPVTGRKDDHECSTETTS